VRYWQSSARIKYAQSAAVEMWRMAKEHQRAAAELNGGTLPDIGEEPFA